MIPLTNDDDAMLGPISGLGPQTEFHGSSSDDAEDPSSQSSSRPNSAHDEEQVRTFHAL